MLISRASVHGGRSRVLEAILHLAKIRWQKGNAEAKI